MNGILWKKELTRKQITNNIQKIDENRLLKKTLNYKPEERRIIGRPQTRSGDDFREEGTGQGA